MAVKLKALAEGARRKIDLLATASAGKSDQVKSIIAKILVDATHQMVKAEAELRKEMKEIQEALHVGIERHQRKAKNSFQQVDTQMSKIKSCDCGRKCPTTDSNDNKYVATLIPIRNRNTNKYTSIRDN